MNTPNDFDRLLTTWLTEDAPGRPPAELLQRSLREAARHQPRPGWVAALRGARRPRVGEWPRGAALVAAAALLLLAVVGIALLAGGVPRPNPLVVVDPSPVALAPSPPTPTAVPTYASSIPPVAGLPGRLAFARRSGTSFDIFTMDPDRSDLVQLTTHPGWDLKPMWSPDGRTIAYLSARNGDMDVYRINADGTNDTRITSLAGAEDLGGWSLDGTRLVYTDKDDQVHVIGADGSGDVIVPVAFEQSVGWGYGVSGFIGEDILMVIDYSTDGHSSDIYRARIGDGRLTQITTTPDEDGTPAVSPDGTRIAFQADRDGGCLFVMDADGSNVHHLTKHCAKGFLKAWAPDGSMIGWAGANRDDADQPWDIHVIAPDGTGERQLTDGGDIVDLSWGPSPP